MGSPPTTRCGRGQACGAGCFNEDEVTEPPACPRRRSRVRSQLDVVAFEMRGCARGPTSGISRPCARRGRRALASAGSPSPSTGRPPPGRGRHLVQYALVRPMRETRMNTSRSSSKRAGAWYSMLDARPNSPPVSRPSRPRWRWYSTREVEVGEVPAVVDDALRVGVEKPTRVNAEYLNWRSPVRHVAELELEALHGAEHVHHLVAPALRQALPNGPRGSGEAAAPCSTAVRSGASRRPRSRCRRGARLGLPAEPLLDLLDAHRDVCDRRRSARP